MITSACGEYLDHCTCQRRLGPRTPAEIEARHRASVARARRSGWANQPPPRWLFELLLPSSLTAWQPVAATARERGAA